MRIGRTLIKDLQFFDCDQCPAVYHYACSFGGECPDCAPTDLDEDPLDQLADQVDELSDEEGDVDVEGSDTDAGSEDLEQMSPDLLAPSYDPLSDVEYSPSTPVAPSIVRRLFDSPMTEPESSPAVYSPSATLPYLGRVANGVSAAGVAVEAPLSELMTDVMIAEAGHTAESPIELE